MRLLPVLLLAGCWIPNSELNNWPESDTDTDVDSDTDSDTDADANCPNSVALQPGHGSGENPLTVLVSAFFDGPPQDPVITVREQDSGANVHGGQHSDDEIDDAFHWEVSPPYFRPATWYTSQAEWRCGDEEYTQEVSWFSVTCPAIETSDPEADETAVEVELNFVSVGFDKDTTLNSFTLEETGAGGVFGSYTGGGQEYQFTLADDETLMGSQSYTVKTQSTCEGADVVHSEFQFTTACAEVVETQPAADDSSAYFRTDLRIELSAPTAMAPTVQLSQRSNGHIVSLGGSANPESGAIYTRFLSEALVPGELYDMVWTHACGIESSTFTVGATGAEVNFPDLSSKVYALDYLAGVGVEPANVGSLNAFVDTEMLIKVVSAGTDIEILVGDGSNTGVQNTGVPTSSFTTSFNNPYFRSPPMSPLHMAIGAIHGAVLEGSFTPDGDQLEGVKLTGSFDTREVGPALSLGGADYVCTSSLFDIDCIPCPDGASYCTPLHIESIDGTVVAGGSLIEVSR